MEREFSARNLNFVERLKTNKLEQSFNKFNFGMNFFIHVPEYFFKIKLNFLKIQKIVERVFHKTAGNDLLLKRKKVDQCNNVDSSSVNCNVDDSLIYLECAGR